MHIKMKITRDIGKSLTVKQSPKKLLNIMLTQQ